MAPSSPAIQEFGVRDLAIDAEQCLPPQDSTSPNPGTPTTCCFQDKQSACATKHAKSSDASTQASTTWRQKC